MEHYLIDVGSPMIDDRRSEDSEPATLHLDSAMCIIYIPPQDIQSFNASAFVWFTKHVMTIFDRSLIASLFFFQVLTIGKIYKTYARIARPDVRMLSTRLAM